MLLLIRIHTIRAFVWCISHIFEVVVCIQIEKSWLFEIYGSPYINLCVFPNGDNKAERKSKTYTYCNPGPFTKHQAARKKNIQLS